MPSAAAALALTCHRLSPSNVWSFLALLGLAMSPNASMAAMEAHIQELLTYVQKKFPEVMAQPVTWDLI